MTRKKDLCNSLSDMLGDIGRCQPKRVAMKRYDEETLMVGRNVISIMAPNITLPLSFYSIQYYILPTNIQDQPINTKLHHISPS